MTKFYNLLSEQRESNPHQIIVGTFHKNATHLFLPIKPCSLSWVQLHPLGEFHAHIAVSQLMGAYHIWNISQPAFQY